MPKGRKPKPRALHILDGTFREDRHGGVAVEPAAGVPSCPIWLDRESKAEWRRVVKVLADTGVLTLADRGVLTTYCVAWSEMHAAAKDLKAGRYQSVGEDGHLAAHPALAHYRAAWKALQSAGALLGLDPSSRTRLKGKEEAPQGVSTFARKRG
jgi:P27 family predicted phage terminase small subunit